VLASIADEARRQQAASPDGDPAAVERTVVHSLNRLASATSPEIARDLEQWARHHFLCRNVPTALYSWRQVLRRAIEPDGGMYARIPPPEPVAALIPEIRRLVGGEPDGIDEELRRLAPPLSREDRELGLRLPAAAMTALEVSRNEATLAALRLIASRLRDGDVDRIAAWGAEQAEALDMPGDRLGGTALLKLDPECLDGPPALPVGDLRPS
jgi:hypothetical protein